MKMMANNIPRYTHNGSTRPISYQGDTLTFTFHGKDGEIHEETVTIGDVWEREKAMNPPAECWSTEDELTFVVKTMNTHITAVPARLQKPLDNLDVLALVKLHETSVAVGKLCRLLDQTYWYIKGLRRRIEDLVEWCSRYEEAAKGATDRMYVSVIVRSKLTEEEHMVTFDQFIENWNNGEYENDVVEVVKTNKVFVAF